MEKIINNEKAKIILNRIQTPDGTILISDHRHDYKTHVDKNGKTYMVDGGRVYLRRNEFEDAPYKEISVFTSSSHEEIREVLSWGTHGKNGKEPLKFITLDTMSNSHVEAVLKTQKQIEPYYKKILLDELLYREENNIVVEN